MLQYKAALESLGFNVEAVKLTVNEFADIRVPSVFLLFPLATAEPIEAQSPIGHYRILWPLDGQSVQILDYPRKPIALSTNYWITHLRRTGASNVPVLLCGKAGQTIEGMLSPSAATNRSDLRQPSKDCIP